MHSSAVVRAMILALGAWCVAAGTPAFAQKPLEYWQASRSNKRDRTATSLWRTVSKRQPSAEDPDDRPFADDEPLPSDGPFADDLQADNAAAPQTPPMESPSESNDDASPREALDSPSRRTPNRSEPDEPAGDLSAADYLQDPTSTRGFPAFGDVRDPRLPPAEDEPFSRGAASYRGPLASRPFGNSIGGPSGLYGRGAPDYPSCPQFERNFPPRRFPLCRTWLSWEPCDDNTCDECSGCGSRFREGANQLAHFQTGCKTFYLSTEGVALRRDSDVKFLAARVGPGANAAGALSSSAVCFPYAGGGQITFGRFLSDRYAIEFQYRGYFHWQGFDAVRNTTANSFGGVGNLSSPYTGFGTPEVAGFDGASLVQLNGVAHYQSYEINGRYRVETCCGPIQAWSLLGVRYLDVREGLTHTWVTDRQAPGATSSLQSYARNQMVGPQIGGQLMFLATPRSWLESEGKVGVAGNQIFLDRTFTTTPNGGAAAVTAANGKRNATAVFGDVRLIGAHAVCSGFVIRVGYQATFVGSIATGASNMPPDVATLQNGPVRIRASATNIYHGPVLGGMVTW